MCRHIGRLCSVALILVLVAQKVCWANSGFTFHDDPVAGELRFANRHFELALSRENGAIVRIVDRSRGKLACTGQAAGCLWRAQINGGEGRGGADYTRREQNGRSCNQHLRQALHMASLVAVRIAPWARELFDRLRNEGKTYGRALRAVGEQLLEILYVLLTRRTRYDEG